MADEACTRISLLSVKDVILMFVERPNGSSLGFNGSVSFVLDNLRLMTTVTSFGFSRITAEQPVLEPGPGIGPELEPETELEPELAPEPAPEPETVTVTETVPDPEPGIPSLKIEFAFAFAFAFAFTFTFTFAFAFANNDT